MAVTELKFQTEVELSKKPLKMDMLVVTKKPGTRITNETGRIFRRYNVIEYKNPNDSLTIDDFYKTIPFHSSQRSLSHAPPAYWGERFRPNMHRKHRLSSFCLLVQYSFSANIHIKPDASRTSPDQEHIKQDKSLHAEDDAAIFIGKWQLLLAAIHDPNHP